MLVDATGEALTVHHLNDDEDESRPEIGDRVELQWRLEHSYVIGSQPAGTPAPTP